VVGPTPVLGPSAGSILFLVASIVAGNNFPLALLAPALYLLIHFLEGQTITPLLLADSFTINPVLIMLSVVFWYWMWGAAGAILATPMLAIAKIICDRIGPLQPIAHLIAG